VGPPTHPQAQDRSARPAARAGSVPGHDDLSSALALTRLFRAELGAFGTGGGEKLGDAEIALAQRTLRALLQRLGIDLTLPWRNFALFRSYWLKNNASGSYQARRDLIEQFLGPLQDALDEREDVEIRAVLAEAVSPRAGTGCSSETADAWIRLPASPPS